ncbi:MAG: hypothetical protein HBSAPP03_05420 [Phycisphaerae bacterium]|nr:MAG: hypothetical protein HBSAPP03_05420 [Phycisphaerae bacterium]
MLPVVLISLLASLALGLAMLWVGLRGRRINDHPVCRQCAFDLHGIYPESVTCPECGAGLKREKSVRIGARRRMVGVTLLGAFLALAPLPPIAAVALAAITGTDVNAYKPLGLILWEARRADRARTAKLAAEVLNRALSKSLSPAQYQTVIEAVLAMQADSAVVWDEGWGDLIERAKLDGVLTAAQESRFNTQAFALTPRTRAKVRAGQVLPVRLMPGAGRVASTTNLLAGVTFVGARIDGTPVTQAADAPPAEIISPFGGFAVMSLGGFDDAGPNLGFVSINGTRAGTVFGLGGPLKDLKLELPRALTPGVHRLEIDLDLDVQPGGRGGMAMTLVNGRLLSGGPANESTRVSLGVDVEVVPDDQPVATAQAPSPDADAALAKALGPVSVRIDAASPATRADRTLPRAVTAEFTVKDLPVPVAFDVFLRFGGEEIRLGSLDSAPRPDRGGLMTFSSAVSITVNGITRSSRADGAPGRASVSASIRGLAASDQVDVVLRPSEDVAAATLELDSYYGGEVVLPGLIVEPGVSNDPFDRMRELQDTLRRQLTPARPRGGSPAAPVSPSGPF